MKRHFNLSVGQRLLLGFGLLLMVLGGFMAAVYRWQSRSEQAQVSYTDTISPRLAATEALERSVLNLAIASRRYLLSAEDSRLQEFHEAAQRVQTAIERLALLPKSREGMVLFSRAEAAIGRYLERSTILVQEHTSAPAALTAEREESLDQSRQSAVTLLGQYTALQEQKAQTALGEMRAARANVSRGLMLLSVLAIGLSLLVAGATTRAVRGPVQELVAVAGALEAGNWKPALEWAPVGAAGADKRPPVRNEMLRLAQAFGLAAAALQRREQRLAADGQVASATARSLNGAEIAEQTLQAVVNHARADVGVVYLCQADGKTLAPIANYALNGVAKTLEIGEGLPGQAAKSRRAVVVHNLPADSAFQVKLGYDQAPTRALAALPITFRDELHGVLVLGSLRTFDEEAITFLDRAAAQLGIGLQNVASHEEIEQLLADIREQHEHIQAQNEELQAQNEEIQAQNEEIQAQSEELQAQNEELKQHGEELKRHANALGEADRQKNEFLGVLAHELRNPLASIANSIFVLKRVLPGSAQAGRAQEVIDRQVVHLTRLIDDLLDITRITHGKIQLRYDRVNFPDLVRKCVEDQRPAFDRKSLQIELAMPEGEVWIDADRTRLYQVLDNLLGNAVKFSESGGLVRVFVEQDTGEGHAALRVADLGVGMEPKLLAQIFKPFSQGALSLDRTEGGLGLGLALVKRLVELHGGSVEAKSDGLGKGSEFLVRLPLSGVLTVSSQPVPVGGVEGKQRLRILVIEDNADAAESLRDALTLLNHQIEVAYTGREGLEKARVFRPDVVLCDIGLPEMNGYEIACAIRADATLRSVHLIALTGYAGPEDLKRASEAGFQTHLAKPASLERLTEALAQVEP
jgi:signal transduction histidine kinase/CHASE3 domain sensor protein